MDPRIDIAKTATCTSCRFKEDKSNYWTAVLYFKHTNGSFIRVSASFFCALAAYDVARFLKSPTAEQATPTVE